MRDCRGHLRQRMFDSQSGSRLYLRNPNTLVHRTNAHYALAGQLHVATIEKNVSRRGAEALSQPLLMGTSNLNQDSRKWC